MRILELHSRSNYYLDGLVGGLRESGLHVDCTYLFDDPTTAPTVRAGNLSGLATRATQLLRGFYVLGRHQTGYDICNIHYSAPSYLGYLPLIKRLARKIVISTWGSDVHQAGPWESRLKRPLYSHVDGITFANPRLRDFFIERYPSLSTDKMHLCHFGLSMLDTIKRLGTTEDVPAARTRLGLPLDKTVVVCGAQAHPLFQHTLMLGELQRLSPQLLARMHFVFPMTYGKADYRRDITERLQHSRLSHTVLATPLSEEDVARLRMAADIYLNLNQADNLSGTMQEHMFAGSVAVVGEWLPYEVLEDHGVYFVKVTEHGVAESIARIVETMDEYKAKAAVNRERIWTLTSFEHVIPSWIEMYRRVLAA